MYISKIYIKNYKCFKENEIEFVEGLNLIIGENNSGKSSLFKALGLIFDTNNKEKPTINDFNKQIQNFTEPPELLIRVTLRSSSSDRDIDKALVANWLTKLESPWEATLTYRYFLPDDEQKDYVEKIEALGGDDPEYTKKAYKLLERYLGDYKGRIYGGNPDANVIADREWISKFDFQFLGPLRDAEKEIYSAKNPLLKKFLRKALKEYKDNNTAASEENINQLNGISDILIQAMNNSNQFQGLKDFSQKTGACLNNTDIPILKGLLEEEDIIDTLSLMIQKSGFEIPISHNGLGYNNLLYISLVLANFADEMEKKQSVYPILVIEEPEAHLHPSLQYNFMDYIAKNHSQPKQIFISSHSTHITAAISLDNIICMSENNNEVKALRLGKIFNDDKSEDQTSKKYIERYLDATKSNLLFAKSIIFVEGITEQILVPTLANYIEESILEKNLSTVIRVDGSCFKHFLKLFDSSRENSLKQRKVACILDRDPQQKQKSITNAKRKACFLCELNSDSTNYDYFPISSIIINLKNDFSLDTSYKNENLKICFNDNGKTFEHDFSIVNPYELIITDSSTNKANLINILNDLSCDVNKESVSQYIKCKLHVDENDWINQNGEPLKCFACNYLESVSNTKGENAFNLNILLRENLKLKNIPDSTFKQIQIPEYIKQAIEWVTNRD